MIPPDIIRKIKTCEKKKEKKKKKKRMNYVLNLFSLPYDFCTTRELRIVTDRSCTIGDAA
jgi:hypothetical protein